MSENNDDLTITDLRQIEILSQRVAELQRLNEEKARTIAAKDDRIVGLVNEVERAQASEAIEVQRSSEARAEVEAMKRQALELVEQRDRLRDDFASEKELVRTEIRDSILQFAEDHDLDREFVNGLLEAYLNVEPAPEFIEATVTVEATVLFKASTGVPADPSAFFVETNTDFDLDVRPHYSSGLEFEEIRNVYVDVKSVEAN